MPNGEHQEGAARPLRAASERRSDPSQAEQHVDAALAAGTRTGASLSAISRTVEQMTDGLNGARDANQQLVHELEVMREMLAQRTEENSSLEQQHVMLTGERDRALRELEQVRMEAERERDFLVDEQDRFLAALLDDHDRALRALRLERDEANARASASGRDNLMARSLPAVQGGNDDRTEPAQELREARRAIEELMIERDRSRDLLRRLQAQRDVAQAALTGVPNSLGDAPLNVTVHAVPAAREVPDPGVATQPPGPGPAGPPDPTTRKGQGRATKPQGPRSMLSDQERSDRRTDPLPRSELARALEASRPSPFEKEPAAGAPPECPVPGLTPPPEELRGAIRSPDVTPTLKRKPDPTPRPLGGYSVGPDKIEAEHIQTARRGSSGPPRRE